MQSEWPDELRTAVNIWSVRLDRADLSLAFNRLSQEEKAQAERFRSEPAQRRFVVTRAALRTLLARYVWCSPLEIVFGYGAAGKPKLASPAWSEQGDWLAFNVAHSGDLALIAMTQSCEIGIDVELLRPVNHLEEIAKRYFHPSEIEALLNTPAEKRNAAFLRCWTCKEAVLKAVGIGITGPLDQFAVPFERRAPVMIVLPGVDGLPCWVAQTLSGLGYVSALACVGESREKNWHKFEDEFINESGA